MNLQTDLFGEQLSSIGPSTDQPSPPDAALRKLAVPCGFMNNKNKPCRRLGSRPVVLNGTPFVCRGLAMVHCEPNCFRSNAFPVPPYEVVDVRWDHAE